MTKWQFFLYIIRSIFAPNSIPRMEMKMFRLVNRDRKEHGLPKLFFQNDLREVARKHSRDMAKKDYFAHENMLGHTPSDRYKLARITDVTSGENLAKIGGFKNPVVRAEIGLMNSPGHRANILNTSFNCVGVALVISERRVHYFTQNFAFRNIVLDKRIPKSARIKKGLRIKGKTVSVSTLIHYRINQVQSPISKGNIAVTNKQFDHIIPFKERGHYTVSLYTQTSKDSQFRMVNRFDIRAKKGIFG